MYPWLRLKYLQKGVTVTKFSYKQAKQLPAVEHCGAQNNANMACCVLEGVATWRAGLRWSITNRTLGHGGHWILSCPDSSVGRASTLKVEGPGFNSQLGCRFLAHTPKLGIHYSQNLEEQAWLLSGQIRHISWVFRLKINTKYKSCVGQARTPRNICTLYQTLC